MIVLLTEEKDATIRIIQSLNKLFLAVYCSCCNIQLHKWWSSWALELSFFIFTPEW